MSVLKPSIEKRITDCLLARVKGDDDLALPDGMDSFTTDKDRRLSTLPAKTARLSLYAFKQQEPQRVGDQRRPVMLNRTLFVECRVLLQGDDDALDAFRQWITQCFASAGQLITDDYPRGLCLSVRESEAVTTLAEDSSGQVLMWLSRWAVEYTTLPADLTNSGRTV